MSQVESSASTGSIASLWFALGGVIVVVIAFKLAIVSQQWVANEARKFYSSRETWTGLTNPSDQERCNYKLVEAPHIKWTDIYPTIRSTGIPLHDLGHQILYPLLNRYTTLEQRNLLCVILDVLPVLYIIAILGTAISATVYGNKSWTESLDTISCIAYTASALTLVRCVVYCVTILPQCDYRLKKCDKIQHARRTSVLQTIRNFEMGYRNDLMFSGHVSFCFLFTLFIHELIPSPGTFPSPTTSIISTVAGAIKTAAPTIGTVFISVASVAMKKHYTIDVIFAYVAAWLAYWACRSVWPLSLESRI